MKSANRAYVGEFAGSLPIACDAISARHRFRSRVAESPGLRLSPSVT